MHIIIEQWNDKEEQHILYKMRNVKIPPTFLIDLIYLFGCLVASRHNVGTVFSLCKRKPVDKALLQIVLPNSTNYCTPIVLTKFHWSALPLLLVRRIFFLTMIKKAVVTGWFLSVKMFLASKRLSDNEVGGCAYRKIS